MAAPRRFEDDFWIDTDGQIFRPGGRRKPSEDVNPVPSDRRQFDRAGLDKSATVMELDEFGNPGAQWECRMVDLSRGGVGLRSRRMVHEGRFVFVTVDMGDSDKSRKMLCGIVRQCRYSSGEGFAVGILFSAPPQTVPVRAWMNKHGFSRQVAPGARPE